MSIPSSSSAPVAVLGASGAQGGPVVRALLAAGRPVRALTRTSARHGELAALGAEPFHADLDDPPSLVGALEGVHAAFLHLPALAPPSSFAARGAALADALRAARVPLSVYTTSGPVPVRRLGAEPFDAKAQALELLRAARVPLVVLRPGFYLGNLAAPWTAPAVLRDGELRYPLPAERPLPWISVEDQARVVLAALDRPDLAGRVLPIGTHLTGALLARGVAEAVGRDVRYVAQSPDAFAALLRPFVGAQAAEGVAAAYRTEGERRAELALTVDPAASHAELGVAPVPVAAWAREQAWAPSPGASADAA